MKTLLRTLVVVGIALLVADTIAAKGPPYKVTIEGPGLSMPVTVRNPALLEGFAYYWFNDLERQIPARTNATGEGYTITRYSDEKSAWDRLTYYPDFDGGPGSIYYDGLVAPNMWTQGQGEWYEVRPEGDAAIRMLLGQRGIRFDAAGYHVTPGWQIRRLMGFQIHQPL